MVGTIDRTANPKCVWAALGGVSSAEILYLAEAAPSQGQTEEQQETTARERKRWWTDVIDGCNEYAAPHSSKVDACEKLQL